jgi:hypothetical protein
MLRTTINMIFNILNLRRCSRARWCVQALRRVRGRKLIAAGWTVWFISCLLLPPFVFSQESDEAVINREYPLKALFIYNFSNYIEWPQKAFADDKSPFVIGVLGTSPIEETLRQIAASKRIGARKISVLNFVSLNDIQPCQVLFVARSVSAAQQRQVVEAMKNRPVLVVGESDGFAALGGDINFFVQANKIRFEINLAVMRQQELKASSKLLAMAKIIDPNPVPR